MNESKPSIETDSWTSRARRRVAAIAALAILASAGTAFAYAFTHTDKTVEGVDSEYLNTNGDILYIHLSEDIGSPEEGTCSHHSLIACELRYDYCQQASRLATAALLAGRTVDFAVVSTCIGTSSVQQFNRFTIN